MLRRPGPIRFLSPARISFVPHKSLAHTSLSLSKTAIRNLVSRKLHQTRTVDNPPTSTELRAQQLHKAVVALGSNLGDRFAYIEAALRLLEQPARFLTPHGCALDASYHSSSTVYSAQSTPRVADSTALELAIVDTSFMYETAPMYFTDQPNFANCACLVRPSLPLPHRLHSASYFSCVFEVWSSFD